MKPDNDHLPPQLPLLSFSQPPPPLEDLLIMSTAHDTPASGKPQQEGSITNDAAAGLHPPNFVERLRSAISTPYKSEWTAYEVLLSDRSVFFATTKNVLTSKNSSLLWLE